MPVLIINAILAVLAGPHGRRQVTELPLAGLARLTALVCATRRTRDAGRYFVQRAAIRSWLPIV